MRYSSEGTIEVCPLRPILVIGFQVVAAHEWDFRHAAELGINLSRRRGVDYVMMPCGNKAEIDGNIPPWDVPCPCGDPSHYLVKFLLLPHLDTQRRN